jgi:imidazoleglycerol-phosphate dehydratase
MRNGTIHRVTGETDVRVGNNLDGRGRCQASTGVLFLNHMLHPISSHTLLNLEISATGDPISMTTTRTRTGASPSAIA